MELIIKKVDRKLFLTYSKIVKRLHSIKVLNTEVWGYIITTRTSVYIKNGSINPTPCLGIKGCLETFRLFMCPSVPIPRDGTGDMIIPTHYKLSPNNSPLKPLQWNFTLRQ